MRLIFFLLLLISINTNAQSNNSINLVLESGFDKKWDLNKGIYYVWVDGKFIEVKFKLSKKEMEKIVRNIYLYKIDKLYSKINIADSCRIMPKIYTKLNLKIKSKTISIEIDTACNNYFHYKKFDPKNVKKFIQSLLVILKSNSEIKNSIESDMIYL